MAGTDSLPYQLLEVVGSLNDREPNWWKGNQRRAKVVGAITLKGQWKLKANFPAKTSSKKETNEFVFLSL